MNKKAVLLINLGTPNGCNKKSISKYLKEFLMDPRVIDLPWLLRWPLVHLFIVPFRTKKILKAYKKIWGNQSPLLMHSQQLQRTLAQGMPSEYQVELGMRYGQPSIQSALNKFNHTDQITIIPLFPQYSSAATGSALEQTLKLNSKRWNIPQIFIKNDFFNAPEFISSYADIIKNNVDINKIDLILFSYHGLPERHIKKSKCEAACDMLHACPNVDMKNRFCYRAQCYETSHLLAKELNLQPHQYQVSFQSRLGRTPWIKPYTDLLLPDLIKKGIKNIAIVCPSFVADCLETLEEINIRAREQWQSLGGQEFIFVPCLNAEPRWVNALKNIIVSTPIQSPML